MHVEKAKQIAAKLSSPSSKKSIKTTEKPTDRWIDQQNQTNLDFYHTHEKPKNKAKTEKRTKGKKDFAEKNNESNPGNSELKRPSNFAQQKSLLNNQWKLEIHWISTEKLLAAFQPESSINLFINKSVSCFLESVSPSSYLKIKFRFILITKKIDTKFFEPFLWTKIKKKI